MLHFSLSDLARVGYRFIPMDVINTNLKPNRDGTYRGSSILKGTISIGEKEIYVIARTSTYFGSRILEYTDSPGLTAEEAEELLYEKMLEHIERNDNHLRDIVRKRCIEYFFHGMICILAALNLILSVYLLCEKEFTVATFAGLLLSILFASLSFRNRKKRAVFYRANDNHVRR